MTGNEFRAARKTLRLSQTEMAEALGIGFRTVQRMEADGCSYAMGLAVQHLLAQQALTKEQSE